MSDFPRKPLPLDRCRHILCKGMFVYGNEYHTPEDDNDRSNDFWCSHTQNVLGPDRGLVVLSKCTPSRECFEPL